MTSLTGAPVAIVLAAGASERMGHDKLFEPLEGIPVVERVVKALIRAEKIHDVVVVIPEGSTEYFSWLRSLHVHLLENPDAPQGMITSIRRALSSSWAEGRDFLLCPADLPYLDTAIVDRVIREFMARSALIVIPAYKGLGGHPGMYAASLQREFFLRGERDGAREILMRHREDTARINVHDPDICFDIDTPDDLRIATDAGARWARVEKKVEGKRLRR